MGISTGKPLDAQQHPHPNDLPQGERTVGNWLIFTSGNGVRATHQRMRALKLDARALANWKIAVIGQATADAVRELFCIEPDCVPESFVAEALAEELIKRDEVIGRRFVLLRAEIARPMIVERLTAAGATSVQDVAVYETRAVASLPDDLTDAIAGGRVDWVTFTSSSTAKNFVALLGDDYLEKLKNARVASIGPITTTTLNELGLPPTVVADNASMQKLVDAIIAAA